MKNMVLTLDSPATIELIEKKIKEIEDEYQDIQGLILNETDLQCLLYRKLYDSFSKPQKTLDAGLKAIQLHTEIPWYDNQNRLFIKPDITLLDPGRMSILHGIEFQIKNGQITYNRLPRKEMEFAGSAIIIEIKFIKRASGIVTADIEKFKRDINKNLDLIGRFDRPNNRIYGIVIIFNKTDQFNQEFSDFLAQYSNAYPRLKVIYCTGKVDPKSFKYSRRIQLHTE